MENTQHSKEENKIHPKKMTTHKWAKLPGNLGTGTGTPLLKKGTWVRRGYCIYIYIYICHSHIIHAYRFLHKL